MGYRCYYMGISVNHGVSFSTLSSSRTSKCPCTCKHMPYHSMLKLLIKIHVLECCGAKLVAAAVFTTFWVASRSQQDYQLEFQSALQVTCHTADCKYLLAMSDKENRRHRR